MPIVTEYNEVRAIYDDARKRGICLPVFAAEDRETIEAILSAGLEIGKEIGFCEIPIIVTWTTRYHLRPQMTKVLACKDPYLGTKLMLSDLEILMSEYSPYCKLIVMPHLDHFIPWLDYDVICNFLDKFASILVDASDKSEKENIKITSEFVNKYKGKIIVEGVVDNIEESGQITCKNNKTTVEKAIKFLDETGVDIIVPNIGTEHRSTSAKAEYDKELAIRISKEVGNILSLHGTSSLTRNNLNGLANNGFIKINIFTILALKGGQAVAKNVINNIGNIFDKKQIDSFVKDGILCNSNFSRNKNVRIEPKLEYLANEYRRASWFNAVKNMCKEYYNIFKYHKYASN